MERTQASVSPPLMLLPPTLPSERLRPKREGVVKIARVCRAAACLHQGSAAYGFLAYRHRPAAAAGRLPSDRAHSTTPSEDHPRLPMVAKHLACARA
jgi:hypothetical protein